METVAPNRAAVLLNDRSPSRMKWPMPPWPMRAVTVTNPMVVTVAIRIPVIITGTAMGNSTRHNS
jgi:hypothetical protein